MIDADTINHIGVSGGKDSTALLLWAIHESGYPPGTIKASFCDVGNESQITYDYVRFLSETVHPIETIHPPLDFYELAAKKQRFPSARARFCTQELKIKPTQRHIQQWLDAGHDVLMHSGVRAGESTARAKLAEREWSPIYDCEVYRPLLHWSLDDVWAIHKRYGIPRNPLYDEGAQRVGCFPCVMSRKSEILQIALNHPERIDRIRAVEVPVRNGNGFSSFFAHDKCPARYASHKVTCADGRVMYVPTIDDVVQWGKDRADTQTEMWDDDAPSCAEGYGLCE